MRLKILCAGMVSSIILLAGCQTKEVVQVDTTHFNASHPGLVALSLHNPQADVATITIPATGTLQYQIVGNPAVNPFYAAQLSAASYCALTPSQNGAYTLQLGAKQSCDLLLQAAQDNPPGNTQFILNLTASMPSVGSITLPLNISLTNSLYAAGEFTQNAPGSASTIQYNHLARWDGAQWLPVTKDGVSDNVNVLAVNPLTGDLYAGGWFMQAGDLNVNHILQINRNGVAALGSGLNQAVNSIAFNSTDGAVITGGNFSQAGTSPMHYLAEYDGKQWTNLDPKQILSGPVRALGVDAKSGAVYVGGNFPMQAKVNDHPFNNGVYYPLYQYTAASGLNPVFYFNDRVEVLLPTPTQGLLIGGDFSQYARIFYFNKQINDLVSAQTPGVYAATNLSQNSPALAGPAIGINHLGVYFNSALSQIGLPAHQPHHAGDFNRSVKSMALVGNMLYISGYFQSALVPETTVHNPYGKNSMVAACDLSTKTCTNIGSPNQNTYWVYRLVADHNGKLYGLSEDENTLDAGQGPDYPYVYDPNNKTWTQLGSSGFNFLAYAEALGSTLTVTIPQN